MNMVMGIKCARKDCTAEAVAFPSLLLRDVPETEPAQAPIPLAICKPHMDETTVDDLVTDNGWEVICKQFEAHGYKRPSRELVQVVWNPLPSDEASNAE